MNQTMQINLIAIGKNMPSWITEGFQEYAKRMPRDFVVHLIEIPSEKRTKQANLPNLLKREGERILKAIPEASSPIIALDVKGIEWSTEQLAKEMQVWHQENRQISLLIGGPEGLSSACLKKAEKTWSLSQLTFPHPLARILIAEQLYRAWSIFNHHPYHRA